MTAKSAQRARDARYSKPPRRNEGYSSPLNSGGFSFSEAVSLTTPMEKAAVMIVVLVGLFMLLIHHQVRSYEKETSQVTRLVQHMGPTLLTVVEHEAQEQAWLTSNDAQSALKTMSQMIRPFPDESQEPVKVDGASVVLPNLSPRACLAIKQSLVHTPDLFGQATIALNGVIYPTAQAVSDWTCAEPVFNVRVTPKATSSQGGGEPERPAQETHTNSSLIPQQTKARNSQKS